MKRLFTEYGQALALNPQAFGMVIMSEPIARENRSIDGCAVVDVHGPLMHHADPFCDSYDAIKARVAQALESHPRALVLDVDSPGGLVAGCFDTATEIRAMCDAAGVPLIAFASGQACSAAYALACVASKLYVSATAIVGSVGVIDALLDQTAQDAALGLRYSLITSGARKADTNPHSVTTDAAISTAQRHVDSLASQFFAHVAARRPMSTGEISSLEADVVVGPEAVALGLADEVATLSTVLALVGTGAEAAAASAQSNTGDTTMTEEEKARAALQAIVDDESSDEKAKARAKAALAAMSDEEPDGDEARSETETEPKPEEEEAKASARSKAIGALAQHGNSLEARVKQLEAEIDTDRKAALRASRPDVAPGVHDALGALPLADYRAALAKIEKPKRPNLAAAVTPSATRGDAQGQDGPRLSPSAKIDLDRRMGLASETVGVVQNGNRLTLGGVVASNGKVG